MRVSVLVGDLREPRLQGKWVYELRLILISNRLTIGEATAVLAHELVHAKLDHRGRQSVVVEAWVDEVAAGWLITDWEWGYACRLCGGDFDCVAARLGVPRWLVVARAGCGNWSNNSSSSAG